MVLGARGAHDRDPSSHRQLNDHVAHAARRAVDQQGLTGSDTQRVQGPGRGLDTRRGAPGLNEVQRLRTVGPELQDGELSRRPAQPHHVHGAKHLVAHLDVLDPRPDLVHRARGVYTRDVRPGQRLAAGHGPGPQPGVARGDTGRTHGDADLSGPGVRLRCRANAEDVGRTEAGILQSEHGTPSRDAEQDLLRP